ncbi:MAG: hypothetical protein ACRER1_05200 [Gammaproteobacteria bacterium]
MKRTIRYALGVALIALTAGFSPIHAATPAAGISDKLLKQAFPEIFGNIRADNPPQTVTLKGGIQIPLVIALQVLKVTQEAHWNGRTRNLNMLVCEASITTGTHFMVLNCETNASYNKIHHGNVKAPVVSPVCRLANPTTEQIRGTWREGLLPYAVAVHFSGTRINQGAFHKLLATVPEPAGPLCPRIQG